MSAGNSDQPPPPLGVRQPGHERRRGDRRSTPRNGRERRRGDRRRQQLRTLLFAAATLAVPVHSKVKTQMPLEPSVSVSIDGFVALRPDEAYDDLIDEAARLYNLSPALIKAVMRTESAFDPLAVSPVGAQGLMQLMPALAAEMGVTDPFDPRENVMGGAKYLRRLLNAHRGNLTLALASYNAGPGNVARYRGVPPFKETRNYVRKITALLADDESRAAAD
ncbi:MAG TPA: lytic transglycosylase domain-containing protein [Vicinamibacterales bacterium]|nr:lytic transglycosylase domain-containing protein [Vicinamibacterales bacterium]